MTGPGTGLPGTGPGSDGQPGGSDGLARAFEAHRSRLLRVAYATVGSVSEAEDCVQEAWLRLRTSDTTAIRDLGAWLTTTVSRLAYDTLGSARARRERYVGPWLPDPLVEGLAGADPADQVTLDESVSMALLVVLERLSPAERTAFLLHDVFGLAFDEVAGVVGRSPAAVRQLASRARRHVEQGRPRFPPTPAEQRSLVAAFVDACRGGDMDRLVALLDPGVVWRADGGGKVTAAHPAIEGAANVARWLVALARRPPLSTRMATVNGGPGLVMRDPDGVLTVIAFTIDNGRIAALDVMRNPDKLTAVPEPS
jgi:RNA polymerase sigma-70 factor (ECF subfamily)